MCLVSSLQTRENKIVMGDEKIFGKMFLKIRENYYHSDKTDMENIYVKERSRLRFRLKSKFF